MIKAVLFDMYRTLGEDVDHHQFIGTLLAHGIAKTDAERLVLIADTDIFDGAEHYEFSTDRDQYNTWRRTHLLDALADLGIEYDVADIIVDQYGDWKAGLIQKFKPFPEMHTVLQQLALDGYIVAICSNWDWDIDCIVQDLGIADVVNAAFSSAQLGVRKPHPAFFQRILDKLELTSNETLFVGDTWETDIRGAVGVGMHAVWIDRSSRLVPELRGDVTRVESLQGVLEVVKALSASQ